jgi:CDP-diacylglycerol--glycerol-3-phosphate 3-phosphatidyltransferase
VLIDQGGMWLTCTALFIIAASTDFLDGYFARKWKQITQLGRILDPFVDKIIVCGAFIFLTPYPESGVCAWVTFTVIAREMFVTVLRSILEQEGVDFSAKLSGKLKMGVQCVAVPLCLASLSEPFEASLGDLWPTFLLIRKVFLILTMAITVYSGLEYIVRGFYLLGTVHKKPTKN